MNSLPNDVQFIVYKYLHYSLTIRIHEDYEFEYAYKRWDNVKGWDEDKNLFRYMIGHPKMMFRMQLEMGKWGYNSCEYVFVNKIHNKKGLIVADLPKNY